MSHARLMTEGDAPMVGERPATKTVLKRVLQSRASARYNDVDL